MDIHGESVDALKFFHDQPASLEVYWIYLARRNEENVAWSGLRRLNEDTGFAINTVKDARHWLVDHGLLERVTEYVRPNWRSLSPAERDALLKEDSNEYYRVKPVMIYEGQSYPIMYVQTMHSKNDGVSQDDKGVYHRVTQGGVSPGNTELKDQELKTNTTTISAQNAEGVVIDLSVKGKQSATPKTKNKTPKPPVAPSPLSPAERDALFDAVILHVFKITSPEQFAEAKESDNADTRAGMISNWLAQGCEKIKGKKVGRISRPATPEHVQKFAAWYAHAKPKISMPKDAEKFIDAWREWGSIVHAKAQPRLTTPAPTSQPMTDAQRQQRQADIAARRNTQGVTN